MSSTASDTATADAQAQLADLLDHPKTWAEVLDLSRLEAYGIAAVAQQYLDTGQFKQARGIVEGLVVINPQDAYFPALLGAICGKMGEEDVALEHYSRALELDPDSLAARVNRADLLLRRGDLETALTDLTAAVKLDPKASSPLGRRALALARATADGLHAVLKDSKKAKR